MYSFFFTSYLSTFQLLRNTKKPNESHRSHSIRPLEESNYRDLIMIVNFIHVSTIFLISYFKLLYLIYAQKHDCKKWKE